MRPGGAVVDMSLPACRVAELQAGHMGVCRPQRSRLFSAGKAAEGLICAGR